MNTRFSLRTLSAVALLMSLVWMGWVIHAGWPRFPSLEQADSVKIGMTKGRAIQVMGGGFNRSESYPTYSELGWFVGDKGHIELRVILNDKGIVSGRSYWRRGEKVTP